MLAKLNAQGIDNVLVVDNLGHGEKWKNLRGKRFADYMHKDAFLTLVESGKVPSGIKGVLHIGACSSTTETNAEYLMHNNFGYTKKLAEWCLAKKIRFIYASSAATYGAGEHGYDDSDSGMDKLTPLNLYGYSKLLFDQWALRTGALKSIAGFKFFNVYGPNEYHKGSMVSVVYTAFGQIKKDGEVRLFKSYRPDYQDGEQRRDFVYVKDCCDVMWWFLNNPKANGLFNLGTGQARTWNDLAKATFTALGLPAKIKYIDMPENLRAQYQYLTEANTAKLRSSGCPTQLRSLEEGVEDYVKGHLAPGNSYF